MSIESLSKYVAISPDGNLKICNLKMIESNWSVVAEVLDETEDPEVALLNPLARHSFWWPLNMFSGPIMHFSELCRNFL